MRHFTRRIRYLITAGLCLASLATAATREPQLPSFRNVTVHDPSVVRAGPYVYVFGSHLASARTKDWVHWEQIATGPDANNPHFPQPQQTFADAIAWVGGENAFWAPDVIRLRDGRFAFYYCIGRLDQPRAVLGIATADTVDGPYTDRGILLRSGMWGQPSPDGTIYDATRHPNAVDPDVFYDNDGRLWMVYGSYSGGIFILELDPLSGLTLPGQAYGRKLIGGHHARIEGASILYSAESRYYYLFLSFGGLAADGGYNVRIARSRQPDGPYYDAAGNELTAVSGTPGTLFDDAAIAPYGVKVIGNYQFLAEEGEPALRTRGYLSPGHNSAYYDPTTGRYFLIFHTRFVGRGEEHEVRVHELLLNEHDWLVAAPHRYAGDSHEHRLNRGDVHGDYKVLIHDKAITTDVRRSSVITLRPNGSIAGEASGSWNFDRKGHLSLVLDGITYDGVITTAWDDDQAVWVRAISGIARSGESLWGSRVATARQAPRQETLPDRLALFGETRDIAVPEPHGSPKDAHAYLLRTGPVGATVNRETGLFTWPPALTDVGVPQAVTVVAVSTSPDNPRQTHYHFDLTALSRNVVRRLDLDFNAPAPGLLDALGQSTGFTTRLPGTGAALPAEDPHLLLSPEEGLLELSTTQADFFGQAGLANNSAPGVPLATLGFTGVEDFSVTVDFRPFPAIEFIDQAGLYVGAHSNLLTRAGTIVFGTPERYSAHTENGADYDTRFFGFGLDVSDGMSITISRKSGLWQYIIDGVEWNPLSQPAFLEGRSDLVAGVFAITPLNNTPKALEIANFSAVVATNEPLLTDLEAWRIRHFGQLEATGIAADRADPDRDRVKNLDEFHRGTDPLDPKSK